jgi:dihydrofolate reductase
MTELVLKMSISLDGYVARPDGSNDWIFPSYTPDATAWTVETLRGAGAHVMGSVTYRAMAAHWPHDTSDFAAPMNDTPKVVFSETMTASEWGDTRFISGELAEGIATLKKDRAPDYLLAHGGAGFVRSLCRTGLIDEIRLLVHPVILGEGERIFLDPMDLTTVATKAFSGGAVAHVLRPAARALSGAHG